MRSQIKHVSLFGLPNPRLNSVKNISLQKLYVTIGFMFSASFLCIFLSQWVHTFLSREATSCLHSNLDGGNVCFDYHA